MPRIHSPHPLTRYETLAQGILFIWLELPITIFIVLLTGHFKALLNLRIIEAIRSKKGWHEYL